MLGELLSVFLSFLFFSFLLEFTTERRGHAVFTPLDPMLLDSESGGSRWLVHDHGKKDRLNLAPLNLYPAPFSSFFLKSPRIFILV